jgi:glutamyl-tRNA reductase
MLCIDLGVPRNIDESVRHVIGVRLYNIDDLKPIVEEVILNRTYEAQKAEIMIRSEVEARYAGYGLIDALPVTCGR